MPSPPADRLEHLPLLAGYYRLENTTVDVRVCPDATKNCSTSFGKAECVSASGCQGGVANPCAPTLRGTYCALCDKSNLEPGQSVFYRKASEANVATIHLIR